MSGPAGTSEPPNWPAGIEVSYAPFANWSDETSVPGVWIAVPQQAQDVVTLANWAAGAGFSMRALGHAHNWSPLMFGPAQDGSRVLLVDTGNLSGKTFEPGTPPRVTLGSGVSLDDATAFLEQQGDNGSTTAPGHTFLNFPGPGDLSMGGILAVGGHGTGLPVPGEPPLDGTLSNLVVAFTAVVSQADGTYTLQSFRRDEAPAAAFLVHLGRAFLTDVTLAVVPNYYLQVHNLYPPADTLFQPTGGASDQSLASLVGVYGRVEVIWFPFTDFPWVKAWERVEDRLEPQVEGPYNYPWTDDISDLDSTIIAASLHECPALTPYFLQGGCLLTQVKAPRDTVLNGTARNLLLYVKPTTLRYSMIGYALQVPVNRLQSAVNEFFTQFEAQLLACADRHQYPVNGPVEIRVTTIDRTDGLGIDRPQQPTLSVCAPAGAAAEDAVVLWVDSLTFPGTPGSGEFYQTLENWMLNDWGAGYRYAIRPEWSKGWAYTAAGPWTNSALIKNVGNSYAGFQAAADTLHRYDAAKLFSNPFLNQLL
ncbi:MAG TPA: cholesterol oxidase substrate-binding domain-containing protein [Microlunatus sp.]|nr:cholesterol oxidase substrate-binding domain-containing protein [Microlunatus sp.]